MRRCRPLLGTFVEVDCDLPEAIDAAFTEIARIHRRMSAHDPDSELSRINRFAHLAQVQVSDDTACVLRAALEWHRLSGGAFDTVRAGARAIERGALPRHPGQPAPDACDSNICHVVGNMVRLERPACIDLGGIAKGYAVDRAVAAMRAAGAAQGLVNAGGDLFGFGPSPWTVEIVDPLTRRASARVRIRDEALATSALVDESAAHLPAGTGWTSVTVRAASACDADALTKIVWAGGGDILASVLATALGIARDGSVEGIGNEVLAA